MKIFIFNRPKRTILNILFIIGLVSFFISILAGITAIIWTYYPNTISKIDKIIPDYYGYNIKKLHENALKTNNIRNKYKWYIKLYNELENISTLNKYYPYRQESAKWLINYYENNNIQKAFKIAKKWEKEYPYDFTGKFIYIDVASKIDQNISSSYIEKLYKKYSDIQEVVNKYTLYQLEHDQYNKALNTLSNKIRPISYAKFQIFYTENKFSEKQSIKYNQFDYTYNGNSYELRFNKKLKKLKKLRVDIDNIVIGTVISEVKLMINNKIIDISTLNQMEQSINGHYITKGRDPYFIFKLPAKYQTYAKDLNIIFTCEIERINLITKKILHNAEWQFFVDTGRGFNEKESLHFSLQNKNDKYISKNTIDFKNVSNIRIDFPSLKGLKIDYIDILINNQYYYNKEDINLFHSIKHDKKYFEIIGNDPYIIINIKNKFDIQTIKIILHGVENE